MSSYNRSLTLFKKHTSSVKGSRGYNTDPAGTQWATDWVKWTTRSVNCSSAPQTAPILQPKTQNTLMQHCYCFLLVIKHHGNQLTVQTDNCSGIFYCSLIFFILLCFILSYQRNYIVMCQKVTIDWFGLMTRFMVHFTTVHNYILQFTITHVRVQPHACTLPYVSSHIFTVTAQ